MKYQQKENINRILRKIWPRKKYKDRLFQRVFRDKIDLLELYNAINHTSYKNLDELEITTLEDAIYLSMKNDLSFILSSTMNLYEHQSTYNPNMPIRGLLYFSKLYEAYIKEKKLDIYGHRLIELPMPQFIVFYNGKEEQPDEQILELTTSFRIPRATENPPALECRALMLNINYGHNKKLLQTCKRLHDYSYFIAEINSNLENGLLLEKAIQKAMETCIRQDILRDILVKSQSEVFDMLLTEYNEKEYLEIVHENEYNIGKAEGKAEGLAEGLTEGKNAEKIRVFHAMLNKGYSKEAAKEVAEISDNIAEEEYRKYSRK